MSCVVLSTRGLMNTRATRTGYVCCYTAFTGEFLFSAAGRTRREAQAKVKAWRDEYNLKLRHAQKNNRLPTGGGWSGRLLFGKGRQRDWSKSFSSWLVAFGLTWTATAGWQR